MLLRLAIFSAGKTFTTPLFVILTLVIVLLLFAARRTAGVTRRLIVTSLVLTMTLWLLSTPAVSGLLIHSLLIPADPDSATPDVIVVASGGVLRGANPEFDTPSYASHARIIAAVQWWRLHPQRPARRRGSSRAVVATASARAARARRRRHLAGRTVESFA